MTAKRQEMGKEGRAQEHAHLTVPTGSQSARVLGNSHAERKSPQSMAAGGILGYSTPGKEQGERWVCRTSDLLPWVSVTKLCKQE